MVEGAAVTWLELGDRQGCADGNVHPVEASANGQDYQSSSAISRNLGFLKREYCYTDLDPVARQKVDEEGLRFPMLHSSVSCILIPLFPS